MDLPELKLLNRETLTLKHIELRSVNAPKHNVSRYP